jgi:hypothetical protein
VALEEAPRIASEETPENGVREGLSFPLLQGCCSSTWLPHLHCDLVFTFHMWLELALPDGWYWASLEHDVPPLDRRSVEGHQ